MPRFLPLCVAVLGCLGLTLGAADRPNILMIVSDDHAWFDYGFMGSKAVSTPHLDKLAAESRLFPRGYVTNSLCGPSLASMLTGRHVHRHPLERRECRVHVHASPDKAHALPGSTLHAAHLVVQILERRDIGEEVAITEVA